VSADVEADVAALEPLNLHQLRDKWRERFGAPPKIRSPDMLRLLLAWRIQAIALGGLESGERVLHVAARGDHQDRNRFATRVTAERAGELDAGHHRHVPIRDYERNGGAELLERLQPIFRFDAVGVSNALERVHQDAPHDRGVIDDEESH